MKIKQQHRIIAVVLCSLWIALTPNLQAQTPDVNPSVGAALEGIPYTNSSGVAALSIEDQGKYTASAILLWSAYRDVESSLKGKGGKGYKEIEDAYVSFAEAMRQLNSRFGLPTALEAQRLQTSSGVVLLAKSKKSSVDPLAKRQATPTVTANPAPPTAPLCNGKPAPKSTSPDVEQDYTCVCNKWETKSRTVYKQFQAPCGRQKTSEETSNWTELKVTNSQGTFCTAAESKRSYTSYTPTVERQRSCSSENRTPRVVPATCVSASQSSTLTHEYTACKKGSPRSHSDKRTSTTTTSTPFLMCGLGSWDYRVSPKSWSCFWDCNGNQTDHNCPRSEAEFQN
jgi:hypothetical protein